MGEHDGGESMKARKRFSEIDDTRKDAWIDRQIREQLRRMDSTGKAAAYMLLKELGQGGFLEQVLFSVQPGTVLGL